jgi:hypothetical protein
MAAASVLAGYTLGGADLLRRAMGKKDKEKMAKERVKFVDGCKELNNIEPKKANEIFDLLEKLPATVSIGRTPLPMLGLAIRPHIKGELPGRVHGCGDEQ